MQAGLDDAEITDQSIKGAAQLIHAPVQVQGKLVLWTVSLKANLNIAVSHIFLASSKVSMMN